MGPPTCLYCPHITHNASRVCRRCLDAGKGLPVEPVPEIEEPEREAAVCVRVANPVEIG